MTHSTSSITNSCNSDDNIVGVEHSTESVTSTGNVFCIKTVFALSKLSIKNCQGYVVECHAEIKRQSDVIAQLNVDKELLAKQQIEQLTEQSIIVNDLEQTSSELIIQLNDTQMKVRRFRGNRQGDKQYGNLTIRNKATEPILRVTEIFRSLNVDAVNERSIFVD